MRLLIKPEACRELRLSLSTLNRRIAAGEVPVKREPRGQRHRVYVMLDDEPPGIGNDADSALAVAQERIRGLEAQVASLQGQLGQERQHNAGLVNDLKAAQEQRGSWWRRFPAIVKASGGIIADGRSGRNRNCWGNYILYYPILLIRGAPRRAIAS